MLKQTFDFQAQHLIASSMDLKQLKVHAGKV